MIGIEELARRLDVPVSTIRRWRKYGRGPRGYKLGRLIKFRPSEVEAWLQQQKEPEPTPIQQQYDWERFGRTGLGSHRRTR